MASTLNAFELLQQAGGLPSGNKTKKKKNKKPAAAKEVDEAPVVQEVASGDAEIAPEATAVPILEKSARTFKTGGDRIKLWKDWIRQATDRGAKALKYKAADGSVIGFKELLLRSRALEITVESCVTSPLTPEQSYSLQQLLGAFISRVDAAALASAISRLAELLAEDAQSFDTTGAAQRAVHVVIGTLKSRDEAAPVAKPASLQDRLAAIEREASKQHGFLASVEKLVADPSKARSAGQGSGISKQHVDSAKELVKLYSQKFDLLQPDSAAAAKSSSGSGPSAATITALEELKAVISNHLADARAIENKESSVKGGAMSKEAQRAQAVAALRREEAVLAQQASDIASQVRALEAQLSQLRGQAAEVEDKRLRLQQRQAAALEALSATTGRKMSGLSAQHYHEELAATQQLLALVDPSRVAAPASQLAAAQGEAGNTAAAYMGAVRALLQMSSSSLADVPGKVVFCRQRISQAEKLASLGGLGKEKSAKTLAESEKLLADTVKHCEEMVAGATTALEGMRSRFPAFSPEQQAELSQLAYEIEDMMSHIKGQYELAMGAVRGQAPGATPAGPYNAAAQGAPVAGLPGGVPVGAPVGGAFVPAPGGPTGVRPVGGLGPIMPPSSAVPGPVATSNGSHAPKPAPVAAAAPRPASAAAAVAAAPAPKAAADGFQQVGGKKNRRKA
ncbi:hypothetical protein OEZ85_002049 [Tetradesmus obliquus]|uniref:Uncharacterized protein n=1 Tax=Tetradesmus obliquus TaxID=3088 RepID=A0ABY8U2A4_TETOB|nr:hypothetical protein OEZ85_002049 [Tetradesmus obliquus]